MTDIATIVANLKEAWEVAEPWVNGITGLAAIAGLIYAAWIFARSKLIPMTIFGYRLGLISTAMNQSESAIDLSNRLKDQHGGISAYVGWVLVHLLTLIAFMIFIGMTVTDQSFRLSLMLILLSRIVILSSGWMNQLRFLTNPVRYLAALLDSMDRHLDGAISTGVKSPRVSFLKNRVAFLREKLAASFASPQAGASGTATDKPGARS